MEGVSCKADLTSVFSLLPAGNSKRVKNERSSIGYVFKSSLFFYSSVCLNLEGEP
jgi:hypothetical protein